MDPLEQYLAQRRATASTPAQPVGTDPLAQYLAAKQAPPAPATVPAWVADDNAAMSPDGKYLAPGTTVSAPSTGEAGLRGTLQGASGGFMDEAASGIKSLADTKDIRQLGAAYRKVRDADREANKEAETAHPLAYGIGQAVGGLATAAVPGLGVASGGLKGAVRAGAKLGGLTGLGNSDADLTKGDIAGAAWTAFKSGALGGAAGAVGYGAGKLAGKYIAGAAERVNKGTIKELAGAQTKSLATPTLQRELTENKDAVIAAAREFDLSSVARKPGALAQQTEAALDSVGAKIGDVYKAADATGHMVPRDTVVQALSTLQNEYEKNPATRALASKIASQINDVEASWTSTHVPASDVHAFVSQIGKTGFAADGVDPGTLAGMRKKAWGAVKDVLTNHVRDVAPEAASGLASLNKQYSGLRTIADVAENRASKEEARNALSGIDALALGLGGVKAVAGKAIVQKGIPMASMALNRAAERLQAGVAAGAPAARLIHQGLMDGLPRSVISSILAGAHMASSPLAAAAE